MGAAKIRNELIRKLVKELIAAGYNVTLRGNRWQVRYGGVLLFALPDRPGESKAVKNARATIARIARERGLPAIGGS